MKLNIKRPDEHQKIILSANEQHVSYEGDKMIITTISDDTAIVTMNAMEKNGDFGKPGEAFQRLGRIPINLTTQWYAAGLISDPMIATEEDMATVLELLNRPEYEAYKVVKGRISL